MTRTDDVIAAIATPIGEGGIAVVRLSGKGAIEVADRGFQGKQPLSTAATHTVHVGQIVDPSGSHIDEVLATVFRGPNSYTAEDVVEISCHGGIYVTNKILESVLAYGARPAEPGEFTKRAFLNGRIDLSQAEAVADLISSRSQAAHDASLTQLEGGMSQYIANVRNSITDICALIELEMDFVDEGIEIANTQEIEKRLVEVLGAIEKLIESYKRGKIFREGVKVVITGRPNVGKSSLLNALLNQERAIVTHISGTTRDVIEECIAINGLELRLVDTAGLRETTDIIELEGIRLAEKELRSADLTLYVADVSAGFTPEDSKRLQAIMSTCGGRRDLIILVFNKSDLIEGSSIQSQEADLLVSTINVSARTGEGIHELREVIYSKAIPATSDINEKSAIVINSRHRKILLKAKEELNNSIAAVKAQMGNELIAVYLRSSLRFLGEITGLVTTDDILDKIFSRFCIGK